MADRYWNPSNSLDEGRFQQRNRDPRDERDLRDYDRGGIYGSDYRFDPYRNQRFGSDYDRPYEGRYEGRYGGRPEGSIGDRVKEAIGMGQRSGPKGYRRSDERILDDVCFRLWANPDIDASEIEVEVKNGNVKLKGLVEERWMKRLSEDIVEDVFGVDDVDNELRVKGSMSEKVLGDTRDKPTEQGAVSRSAAAGTAISGTRR